MKLTQPDFGIAIRTLRELHGEGIRAVAARAGISKGLLSRIERGHDVQLSTVNKILNAHRLTLYVKAK
jgi:transcriptional regulator with XRE-family HTH domain